MSATLSILASKIKIELTGVQSSTGNPSLNDLAYTFNFVFLLIGITNSFLVRSAFQKFRKKILQNCDTFYTPGTIRKGKNLNSSKRTFFKNSLSCSGILPPQKRIIQLSPL